MIVLPKLWLEELLSVESHRFKLIVSSSDEFGSTGKKINVP